MRNQKWKHHNAYKHGVFSRYAIVPGENKEEFETLYSALVQEWMPVGATEEDAVLSLAEAMWRKHRAQRFLGIQVAQNFCNPNHPSYDEYSALSNFAGLLRLQPEVAFENASRALKPEMNSFLRQEFPRDEFASISEWAQAVVSEIETVLLPEREPPQDPTGARPTTLLLSAATFTDEFVDQQLKLVERLESMIDRAVKRLVQIKVMKQMLGQTGTERTENRSGKVVKLSYRR
jgi:hypothetical protein